RARPDRGTFPAFDEALQADLRRETGLFFQSIVTEDRSVLDLLEGQYTFLNERLANHYGIKNISGSAFRRVSLAETPRAGLLTQASVLTLTSHPTKTSPVKRGKWVLENFLGAAPPPPPPNVPPLDVAERALPGASVREQMALHRRNPACTSCHLVMDQIGFGLENFDGIGRWRDQIGGKRIEANGELPGGEKFEGPLGLIRILDKRRDAFCEHF